MNKVVIYESTYGSTAKYAKLIANRLDCEVKRMRDVEPETLEQYDLVILGLCLLGGRLIDAGPFRTWIEMYPTIHWVLFVVGLSNPELTDFDNLIASSFSPEIAQEIPRFHFRGVVRYKRMTVMHELLQQAQSNRQPLDSVPLGNDTLGIIRQYGTSIDAKDTLLIQPLIQYVEKQEAQFNYSRGKNDV